MEDLFGIGFFILVIASSNLWVAKSSTFNVLQYGAKGDAQTNDSPVCVSFCIYFNILSCVYTQNIMYNILIINNTIITIFYLFMILYRDDGIFFVFIWSFVNCSLMRSALIMCHIFSRLFWKLGKMLVHQRMVYQHFWYQLLVHFYCSNRDLRVLANPEVCIFRWNLENSYFGFHICFNFLFIWC